MENPKTYEDLLKYALETTDVATLNDEQKKEFSAYCWDLTVKAARESFSVYAKLMLPELIPEYVHGRHVDLITEHCQDLYNAIRDNNKKDSKLQIAIPPESSKTAICSHLFPSWVLGKHPKWRVIVVCHSGEHAGKEIGNPIKQIIKLNTFQEIFPDVKISDDMKANNFWKTNHFPGGLFAGGHGGAYPGKRANLLIGDDMNSEQDSASERATINKNYSRGLESRLLAKNSGQLLVQTRWFLDDISGYTQQRDRESTRPWRVLSIPGILSKEAAEQLRRHPGEETKYVEGGSYWPEHKPIEDLLYMKATWPARDFAAVVQQNPIPDEGAIFKPKSFQHWRHPDPPEVSTVLVSLDTAFTERETRDSAYSAYSIWGIFPKKEVDYKGNERVMGNMILLGFAKGRWTFPELVGICDGLYTEYKNSMDFFLIEDRASGQSLIQELRARGFPVMPFQPEKDKITRAWASAPALESGRVYVNPNLMFTQEFLNDVLSFPESGLDTTDTMTMAILWMLYNWQIVPSDYIAYKDEYDLQDTKFKRNRGSYWGSVSSSQNHLSVIK